MRDIRQLFFSRDDVLAAVMYFRQRAGVSVPLARLTEVSFSARGREVDTVITLRDFGTDPQVITIDPTEMMATVLRYCFYLNIPLPSSGERRLAVIGDELVLTIQTPVNDGH